MSQQEFDNYLALLTRLLRIAPQQREQVAEEFRTHMEDRLDDLLSRGIPRDRAVQLALEEFGDAAGLAAQIANISAIRKRRWYMRVSAYSVAGLAAAVLLAIALWPESQRLPATSQAVAQQPGGMKGMKGKMKGAPRPATLEDKLSSRIGTDFIDTPLGDVFAFLSDTAGMQIYVNRRALSEESIALDSPVNMTLKDVKVETVLDLALEQVSDQLAYLERDGVLVISTVTALEGATEVQVYNCRDLLALTTPQPGMMGMEGGMGSGMMPGMGGMRGMGMPGMGMPGMPGMGPGALRGGPAGGGGIPEAERAAPAEGVPSESPQPDKGDRPAGAAPGGKQPGAGAPDASTSGDSPAESALPSNPGSDNSAAPRPGTKAAIGSWKNRNYLAQIGGGGGSPAAGGMGAMMGGGMPGMGGGMAMGGGGMMASKPEPQTDHERRAARLMNLITTAVDPGTWQDTGGFGTISEYEGLIVVNHNARTHKKIENVLSMLRQAAGMPMGPSMAGMGGMMGGMGGMGSGMMMGGGGGGFGGGFPSGDAGGGASGGFPGGNSAGGGAFGGGGSSLPPTRESP